MTDKKSEQPKYVLKEVATQTGLQIQNTETNEPMSVEQTMVLLLNEIEQIKKHIMWFFFL